MRPWDGGPSDLGKDEYLILSTQGGIRAADGSPIALGYHTGHWEVGLLAQAAARGIQSLQCDSVCWLRQRSMRWPDTGYTAA